MAYIGSPVQQVLSRPTSQSFNGDGSTTVFTLNRSVNVSEELEVFVSNVQQEPGVGKSYTANGTSLTFDEAPPSGTGNIYVIYRGLSEVTRVLEHHPNNPLAATTGTFSDDVFLYRADGLNFSKIVNPEGAANVSPLEFHVGGGMAIHIDNSTNVGIGTTDPGAKLEVDRGSASFAAIFGAPQGSGKAVLFKDNHASPNRYNYLIGSQYNINNGFEITPSTAVGGTTFSNPAIAILETGRIGIGTNSPGRQLEITDGNSGKIRVSGPDGGMIECWNGVHGVYFGSGELVTGTGNSQDSVIFVEGGGSQRYYTSGYERMRIDSSGNVGIGNASPSSYYSNSNQLVVGSGAARQGITIASSTSTIGQLAFADGTSGDARYEGWVIYDHNTDHMSLGTSAEERLRITSGGKVGIGTTTNTTHSLFIHNSDYQQLGLSGNTPTIWLKETDGNANENYQIRLGNGALQFQTQNDAQTGAVSKVIFDSSGRVTMPSQPSFAVTRNQGSVTNAVYVYSSAYHNTGNHYNSSNGRFTAPVTGSYFIATNHMSDNTGTQNNVQYAIRVNGSTHQLVYSSNAINVHMRWSWAGVIYLNQGDYIDIFVSSGLNLYGNSNLYTQFSGYLLG
jgi:hypothetical protein